MLRNTLAALAFAVAFLPTAPGAQNAPMASLVADKIELQPNRQLIAQGNLEILYGSTRIKARRIVYSGPDGALQIDGPITLIEGDQIILLASSAEMDRELRNGILRSARMVLNQQLQLAAAEIHRIDGRYTQLYKTVASSCHVCDRRPTPLWQIRAKRIIHDQQERQLYFDNAQLRVLDVPVFYLPRLRLPDPSLKRATGFLVPTFKSTSKLSWGLKLPYFITLGDHADITLTPYLSGTTKTLELRFRRAFRNGELSFDTAFSDDDIRTGQKRNYFFGRGKFDLKHDFTLEFDVESTSDPAYLLDYGYSGKDRLDSAIRLSRARRDDLFLAELIHYHSLRSTENNDTIPSWVGQISYQKRFEPAFLGGEAGFRLETQGFYRSSDTPGNAGRDRMRATAQLDWRRSWIWRNGMVGSVQGQLNADFYNPHQGAPGEMKGSHITPALLAELRWPLVKTGRSGASHVLEPVLQLIWSGESATNVADEDSRLVEFDEANLFSLSRFPGADRRESGWRGHIGLSWARYDPAGWSSTLSVGRILRTDSATAFQNSTGLAGRSSDWLAVWQLTLPNRLRFINRAVFDDNFNLSKSEARLSWKNNTVSVASSYIWMPAEPYEGRPRSTSEWSFDGRYRFSPNWLGKMDWRYDFTTGDAAYAGLGLEYRNECVKVDLSLSRRFTSSGSLAPTTDFGLTVSLTGFGTRPSNGARLSNCTRYN